MIKVELKFKDRVLKEVKTSDKEITIGRCFDNIIRIDNPAVSKYHARIFKEQDQFYIEDLNSTNGTFINEKPISRIELRDEDEVMIGKHTLKIFMERTVSWRPVGSNRNMSPDRTMELETKGHKERLGK